MDSHFERAAMTLLIPVSWGELFDKVTILEIKAARVTDKAKLKNIRKELQLLAAIAAQARQQNETVARSLEEVTGQLRRVNKTLWDIEDEIRDCEREKNFGPRFIELARAVYKTNDQRAALKLEINKILGSELIEEKSYRDY
ncbi:MAG: hypothetical protein SCH71_01050 [Desulfobulbaceae bacterium]|nr:hypothetical protein [Desulfobulbaceae bacterium]